MKRDTCKSKECSDLIFSNGLCLFHYEEHKKHLGLCSLLGCIKKVYVRGLCSAHYYRLKRNGSFDRKTQTREGVCSVEGCEEKVYASGLCNKHWQRKREYGTTDRKFLSQPWRGKETKEQYFERNTKKNEETGCVEWTGYCDRDGYGSAWHEGGPWPAHRLYYHLFVEPIPKGKIICHHCDNTSCINPDHLYAGTHKTNAEDKVKRGRSNNPKGENAKASKLTKEQAIEVIKRRKSGERAEDIAQDYVITKWTVYDIMKGNSWKELDECRQ